MTNAGANGDGGGGRRDGGRAGHRVQWQFHRWQPTGQASAPTTSQTPFNGKTLHPGEVAQVASTNGARMQPAADGMIRSYGTTVKIAETGTADMVSDASTAIARPPGARCWRSP